MKKRPDIHAPVILMAGHIQQCAGLLGMKVRFTVSNVCHLDVNGQPSNRERVTTHALKAMKISTSLQEIHSARMMKILLESQLFGPLMFGSR
jgi:hypothetical protein